MLSCRLLQCLGPDNTLTAEGCFEAGPAMHFSNEFFGVNNFGNTKAKRLNFFTKCSKCHLDSKTSTKY